MSDREYTSNSNKYREAQKDAEAQKVPVVVKGNARVKKKTGANKLADVFISDDVHNVKDYLIQDILLPTIKKAILGALDMVLPGGNGNYSRSSSTPKVSYRKYYEEDRRPSERSDVRKRFDYDPITFEHRGDAEIVLDQMYDTIKEYGFVTVAAMYDMAGLSHPFTSNKYGWTSLRTAEIVREGGDYVIKLPKAMPID